MDLNLDPEPARLTILHCGYRSPCRALRCASGATTILRKSDRSGHPIRQVELCDVHAATVVERERENGLDVSDWRS